MKRNGALLSGALHSTRSTWSLVEMPFDLPERSLTVKVLYPEQDVLGCGATSGSWKDVRRFPLLSCRRRTVQLVCRGNLNALVGLIGLIGGSVFTNHLLLLCCIWQQPKIGKGRWTDPSPLDTWDRAHRQTAVGSTKGKHALQIKLMFQLQLLYQPAAPASTAQHLQVLEIFGSIHWVYFF